MNAPPTAPLHGPPHPANPLVPPYGHPVVQVLNPPHQLPDDPAPPVAIISDAFAARTLGNSYNVRSSFGVGLGTPHPIRPYPVRGIRLYTLITRAAWNRDRLQFDSAEGLELRHLLEEIYQSVVHHQEALIDQGISAVYSLPRGKRMWIPIISVLLAPFETQLYIESGREGTTAAIWGDFSRSQRPHPDELGYAVDLALNTPM